MNSTEKDAARRDYANAVAAALCVLAPAVVFLTSNNYSLFAPEVSLVYSISLVVGVVVAAFVWLRLHFFVYLGLWSCLVVTIAILYGLGDDWRLVVVAVISAALILKLKKNTAIVLIIAAAAHILSTITLNAFDRPSQGATLAQSVNTNPNRKLPPVVHLVMDEFIGLYGMQNELPGSEVAARKLLDGLQGDGFTIYSHAYSQYTNTTDSLPNLLNFSSLARADSIVHLVDDSYVIDKNLYFEHLSSLGYKIHVYQSSYVDMCSSAMTTIASCITYENNSIESIADIDISTMQKSRFILSSYQDSSRFVRGVRRFYGTINRKTGKRLPRWPAGNSRTGPLAVMPTIKKLMAALRTAAPGDVYFAHLMLPHFPYVLDSDCNIKPSMRNWLSRFPLDFSGFEGESNSDESRAERYSQYFEQIECTQSILRDLLSELERSGYGRDAVVIIQGDHGSRITRHRPSAISLTQLVDDDYRDAYSTLFALRNRNRRATIIEAPRPLQSLLADAWQIDISIANEDHQVFMQNGDKPDLLATPLLGFGPTEDKPNPAETLK